MFSDDKNLALRRRHAEWKYKCMSIEKNAEYGFATHKEIVFLHCCQKAKTKQICRLIPYFLIYLKYADKFVCKQPAFIYYLIKYQECSPDKNCVLKFQQKSADRRNYERAGNNGVNKTHIILKIYA